MDLAASVQQVTEEIVLRLTRSLAREGRSENLCLAGGVALNCVANGKILRERNFKNIWIQPAAGDAGGAVGAALGGLSSVCRQAAYDAGRRRHGGRLSRTVVLRKPRSNSDWSRSARYFRRSTMTHC